MGAPQLPNPVYCDADSVDYDICTLVFAGLTRFDPAQQRVVPDIATDWWISPDYTKYTFHLSPTATWHDGEQVTADDVIFTYETILQNPEYQGPFRGAFKNVKIKRVDDLAVTFELERPEAFFLRDTTIGLLPAHLLAAEPVSYLPNLAFNQKPVGCGPYKLTSLTPSEAKFVRHESRAQTGFIDNIVLNFYPDFSTMSRQQAQIKNIKTVPNSAQGEFLGRTNFVVQEVELPQYVALFFNTEKGVLRHKGVRQSLRSFINVKQILAAVAPAHQIFDPIFIRATKPLTDRADFYDPQLGNKKLAELGWHKTAENYFVREEIREDDQKIQKPVVLRLLTFDRDDFWQVSVLVADMLGRQGIRVEVDVRTGDDFLTALTERDYDLLLYGETVGRDLDFYPFWHSSQCGAAGLNLAEYANLEVDRLLMSLHETFDGGKQSEQLTKVRDLLLETVPAVWLYKPVYLFAHEPELHGVETTGYASLADRLRQLAQNWSLKTKLQFQW